MLKSVLSKMAKSGAKWLKAVNYIAYSAASGCSIIFLMRIKRP
jgi:hypothetical protein